MMNYDFCVRLFIRSIRKILKLKNFLSEYLLISLLIFLKIPQFTSDLVVGYFRRLSCEWRKLFLKGPFLVRSFRAAFLGVPYQGVTYFMLFSFFFVYVVS